MRFTCRPELQKGPLKKNLLPVVRKFLFLSRIIIKVQDGICDTPELR